MSGFGNIMNGINQEHSSSQMYTHSGFTGGNLRGSPAETGRGGMNLQALGGLQNMSNMGMGGI